MKRFFYHGIEPYGDISEAVRSVIDIIKDGGIKLRSECSGSDDENLKHICLYRKNMEFDYSSPDFVPRSARPGWIDRCMVFVISGDIQATYIPPYTKVEGFGKETDLVDEWRCLENIPLDKIIGIALPLDLIKKTLNGEDPCAEEGDILRLREALEELKTLTDKYGLKTFNSETKDFTDKLDEQYSQLSEQEEVIE